MKKLLSLAFSAALVLVSCETEQLNDSNLNGLESTKLTTALPEGDCVVSDSDNCGEGPLN